MNRKRKAPPSCIRYIYRAIANTKFEQMTLEQLTKILKSDAGLDDVKASTIVTDCINEKVLIPVVIDNGRGSPRLKVAEGRPLSLPKLNEIPVSQHDFYCFECHFPGDLESCPKCPRTFHRECYRKDPERPNYEVPSAKVQKNQLPEFSSESESEAVPSDSEPETKSSSTPQLATNAPDTTANTRNSTTNMHWEENKGQIDLNIDMKAKVDVMFLGEIRPPTRSRRSNVTSSYAKNEVITFDDEDFLEDSLCTCCRLSKCAALRNPPNLESDELCHLLNFTYSRNKSWISPEAIAYLDSLKDKEHEVLRKVLLQTTITPKDIAKKIETNSYSFLMEFLIDILDLQHHIGVLYGDSTELDSTKWLVRDITHDLAEIGRCPDCYRYSNHRKTKGWFCKPCVQRHELVYAKHPGFPFWPAKVIRVLPNNKYDVRFFGGNHSRALVDVKNIKPIDTDPKLLKLSRGNALRNAMDELKQHQLLLLYPPSQFSFRADREQVQRILENVQLNTAPQKSKRSEIAHNSIYMEEENGEQSLIVTQSSSRKRRIQNASYQSNVCNTRSRVELHTSFELQKLQKDLDGALNIIKENKKKRTELSNEIKLLKESIMKMEKNIEIVKRKQWCFWCFKEAILLCCFKASYCSEECQKAHWDDGHSKVCKNRDLQ